MTTSEFIENTRDIISYFSGPGRQGRINTHLAAMKKIKMTNQVTPDQAAWIILTNACLKSATTKDGVCAWIYEMSETWERDAATPLMWLSLLLSSPALVDKVETVFIDKYTCQVLIIQKDGKVAKSEEPQAPDNYLMHDLLTIPEPALKLLTAFVNVNRFKTEQLNALIDAFQ